MSFPTRLSSSPSLQRDYAILGNTRLHQAAQPAPLDSVLVEEDEGEDANDDRGHRRRVSATHTDGGESSISAADQATDNMSNLSLPDEALAAADTTVTGRTSSASKRPSTSRPASTHITSPYLGPTSDRSRGNWAANLHQHATSPIQFRRQSVSVQDAQSGPALGGLISSSLILGGQHLMPPADADMRSQTELDYSLHSSVDAHFAVLDDDRTPRPRTSQTSLYHGFAGAPAAEERVQHAPTEASPLLGASSAYGSPSGYGGGASNRARKASWGMGSGWDVRQPAPPDENQLAEIALEPEVNLHRRELMVLLRFSSPIWLTHLLELSLNVVSVFSLGHLGTNELAAASLSSMTANVTGFSILAGFISALDSILPGAYTSQPKMVGLYTQRMGVVTLYLLVPICAVWLSSEWILLALGQDPIVASLASQYLRVLVIGLPGYAGFEVCRRYLQAQGLMHAPTMVLFVVSPINLVLNWLLVWGPDRFRFGFVGAPIASVVSMWLMCVLGAAQCYVAPRVAWDGWSMLAFSGLGPIWQLGTAGTFAMCAEWWSWEIVGLVTSKLGTIALAAQSVLLVCSSISYQLPYAISVAAAVRVGNLLGASQPMQANVSSNMAMLLSLCAGVANSTMFMLIRNQLGGLFSEDADVVRLVTAVLPVMAAFQIMDGVCGVAAGILRGTGRQSAGAIINLTGYYAIGIPIGLLLTFGRPHWGLSGLWIGLTVALTYAAAFSYLLIRRTDWKEEMRKTLALMESGPEYSSSAAAAAGAATAAAAASAEAAANKPADATSPDIGEAGRAA